MDIVILKLMQSIGLFFGHDFIIFCARWIVFLFPIAVIISGLRVSNAKSKELIRRTILAACLATVISYALGFVFERMRPFRADKEIHLLIPAPSSFYSFPSIHTSFAFAVAFAILMSDLLIGSFTITLALLVAFGRMAAGVHYPTDILGGIVVGFFSSRAATHLLSRYVDLQQVSKQPRHPSAVPAALPAGRQGRQESWDPSKKRMDSCFRRNDKGTTVNTELNRKKT